MTAAALSLTSEWKWWHYHILGPSVHPRWPKVDYGGHAKITTTLRTTAVTVPAIVATLTSSWGHNCATFCGRSRTRRRRSIIWLLCSFSSCFTIHTTVIMITFFIFTVVIVILDIIYHNRHIYGKIIKVIKIDDGFSFIRLRYNCIGECYIIGGRLRNSTFVAIPNGSRWTDKNNAFIIAHYSTLWTVYGTA